MPRGVPKAGFRKMTKNAVAPKSSAPSMVRTNVPVETDAQIRTKLKERFAAMNKMAGATLKGLNKSLIISGPAGLGKSYGVMQMAEKYIEDGNTVEVIKGFVRATGLYKALYENRFEHCVVIFDDADSIFEETDSLNLLKCATDMTRRRTLSWRAETNMTDQDGEKLPTSFDFEGRIIFITNTDFDWTIAKGNKLAPHFEAMISRSIYLDLAMHTRRDYMMRIEMVVEEGMLTQLGLNDSDGKELLLFIDKNCERLRELSLWRVGADRLRAHD